jgi:signal transduction histidine kinase
MLGRALLLMAQTPEINRLQTRLRSRLTALGFTREQCAALASIELTAQVSAYDFLKQVRPAARLLVLLETSWEQFQQVLEECDELIRPAGAGLSSKERAATEPVEFDWARALLRQTLLLIAAETIASVEHADSDLVASVLEASDQAEDREALLDSVLSRIVEHCHASAAALFSESPKGLVLSARTGTGEVFHVDRKLARSVRGRPRVLTSAKPSDAPYILVPAWLPMASTVWSLPHRSLLLQIAFENARQMLPGEVKLLRIVMDRCLADAAKFDAARRLRDLSVRMLEVEELERRRIARELHDDAGQSLVVIRLQIELLEMALPNENAQALASLGEIRALTEKTILGVRSLISDLSPAVLQQLGLGAAVRQLTNRFRSSHSMRVRLHVGKLPETSLRLQMVIYRVLQECFQNISRHSRAKNINVLLTSTDTLIRLSVEDDGIGFKVDEGLGRRNCFGLLGMRERVYLIGGVFSIESTPNRADSEASENPIGTKVTIDLPITGEYRGLPLL